MSIANVLFWLSFGLILGAKAVTLKEVEEKINNLDKIEQTVEWLVKEFYSLKGNKSAHSFSELEEKLDNVTDNADQLDQRITNSEEEITRLQNMLDDIDGVKSIRKYPYNSTVQLRDHDYLKLQFLGADGWLGCPDSVCDLRTCPNGDNYRDFTGRCWGEEFQIIAEGTKNDPIKSGQRIRLRYLREANTWMGCPANSNCDKRTCPGTTAKGTNFNDGCWGETFRIYARGKANGQLLYNGDVVMLYYVHNKRYVSIQGNGFGDDTSLNFCPGIVPPPYLSYGYCRKNAFRIYRKL